MSALARGEVHTYNTRSAWGLAVAGTTLREQGLVDAALRNCRWALTQRDAAGWFANTGFSPDEVPLLHTIAYVLEGLQGVHALTGDEELLQAVIVATDALKAAYRRDGFLAGRFGPGFSPAATWRCLTGEAQIATVLLRLARTQPGREDDDVVGRSLLEDVARVQLGRPGVGGRAAGRIAAHGGVPGSYPVWGEYCSFCALNWATKFFLDGLLIAVHGVDEPSFIQARPGATTR